MAKFDSHSEKANQVLTVHLKGGLDEDTVFPPLNLGAGEKLRVDFKDVDAINSCGVREWVKWLGTVADGTNIDYLNSPKIIVDQINMVGGLLRKGVKVQSFETPFFCEKCSLQTNVLFTAGKEYTTASPEIPEVKCQKCQGPTEIDVMETKYFKFLTRQL